MAVGSEAPVVPVGGSGRLGILCAGIRGVVWEPEGTTGTTDAIAGADDDVNALRRMELFYDAVATLVLKTINSSPEDYALFLQRMINYNVATSSSNNTLKYNRHATLHERQRVIRQIDLQHSPVTQITITALQPIRSHRRTQPR